MDFFGNLEQVFADLYPYRWPITALILLALAGAAWLAYQRGWHRVIARRPMATAIVVLPLLAIALPIGYYLLSPLWTRTYLEEASPLVLAAVAATPVPAATTPPAEPDVAATATPGVALSPTHTPDTATPTISLPDPTVEPTATPESGSAQIPEPEPTVEPLLEPTVEPDPVVEPQPEPTAEPESPAVEPEPEPAAFVPVVVRSGAFYGADDFHFGSGNAFIIETEPGVYVFRVENFSVRNGPDLFIYLSTNPNGWSDDAINLGGLKATDGAFNYDIPAGTDISVFQSAIVWCREFAVLFSTAPLL